MEENEILVKLGLNIKKFRKEKGLNQLDLALNLRINSNDISSFECGKRNVTVKTVAKIAAALGVSVKDLFDFN